MAIYSYWEAQSRLPAYLSLIVSGWVQHLRSGQLEIINHVNLHEYAGGYFDLQALKRFSLPKQSDAVSAAVLYERGGLFLDTDTIIVGASCKTFIEGFSPETAEERFRLFGVPSTGAMHIAVISASAGSRVARLWVDELSRRIGGSDNVGPWNYLGNAILEPLYGQRVQDGLVFDVLDLIEYGVIAESLFGDPSLSPQQRYVDFWFSERPQNELDDRADAICKAKAGLVMLHNSWTPRQFMGMTGAEILGSRTILGELLRRTADADLVPEIELLMRYGGRF